MFSNIEDVYQELKKDRVTLSKIYTYSDRIKTSGKTMKMSLGRIWFNLIMPPKYKLVNEPVTRKIISKITNDILKEFGAEVTAETMEVLSREAFKLHTFEPITFSDEDFILPDNIAKMKKDRLESESDPIKFSEQLEIIAQEYLKELKKADSALYKFIASGAKGKPIDMAILLIARGSAVDMEGNISKPTANSVTDGFNLREFYEGGDQARAGLYTRSIGASEPGALARDIAYANSNIMLSKTKDCKTRKQLELQITDQIANSIVGRKYISGSKILTITTENVKSLIGKSIKMRSPLYCIEPKGICQTCYGNMGENLDQTHIGLLAASTLNTQGLNAFAMKQRHQSTVTSFKETDLLRDLIR